MSQKLLLGNHIFQSIVDVAAHDTKHICQCQAGMQLCRMMQVNAAVPHFHQYCHGIHSRQQLPVSIDKLAS